MDGEDARLKTGITGLDSMLYGGVPQGDQVLIAGGPGTGKTLLSFQIAYDNAKNGIPAAFIALEEQPGTVLNNAKRAFEDFKDIDELVSKGTLIVDGEDPARHISVNVDKEGYSFGNVVSDIEGIVRTNNAKVVVIDSLTLLKLMMESGFKYRKSMVSLMANLRRLGVTSFLTAEIPTAERRDLKFSEEFFIFDGIVAMYQNEQEDKRMLMMEIVKMRGSNHSWALAPYEVTPQGFKVLTAEQ